jgi:hypothetical protein
LTPVEPVLISKNGLLKFTLNRRSNNTYHDPVDIPLYLEEPPFLS